MQKLHLLFILCATLCINNTYAQYFEFQVETTTPNETFTIPTDGSYSYDYNVEIFTFGNPNVTTYNNVTGDLTHTFSGAGSHFIRILDGSLFPRIDFSNSPDKLKIVYVYRWGSNPWATFEQAFEGCANLKIQTPDTPNLTNVTSTNRMFRDATILEDISTGGNIGNWDMSNVTDMGQMFKGCTLFNEDLSNWDTSSVQTFSRMFQGAPAFDANLGKWDISNLNSGGTSAMFAQAGVSTDNYDQTILGWGTLEAGETQIPSGLTIRFDNSTYCTSQAIRTTLAAAPFNWTFIDNGLDCNNLPDDGLFITTWETTTANETITIPTAGPGFGYYIDWGDGQTNNAVTGSISHAYTNAGTHTVKIGGQFPRIEFADGGDRLKIMSIDQWGDMRWTSMFNAFEGCSNLTYNATDAPNLSNVTQMDRMFSGCSNFNATNLNNWDVSNIKAVSFLFNGASTFNADISGWNVSNIHDFRNMFTDAINFNQNISGWVINTSEAVDMEGMFVGAVKFNQPIGSWNVSEVTDMKFMFERALDFNQPLNSWNVSNVMNMNGMFFEAFDFNQTLGSWDISSVTNMSDMLDISGLSLENYDATLIGWATLDNGETIPSGISLGAQGLIYCLSKEAKDILENAPNNWAITDAGRDCSDYVFRTTWRTTTANESITIPTNSVSVYNYDVDWGDGTVDTNVTGNATHTYATIGSHTVEIIGDFPRIYFGGPGIDGSKIIAINQWGVNEWTTMNFAFSGCSNLEVLATDAPDLSNATTLISMLSACTSLSNPDLSNWDVSTITSTKYMFAASNFNGNINNWDVGNVVDFTSMFAQNHHFNQNISSWNIGEHVTQPITMEFMFSFATAFDQPIGNWDVSLVTDMESMFQEASVFNQDLGNWNASNVTNMRNMFKNQFGTLFNQNLGSWDISSVNNMSNMFDNTILSIENYDATLIGWATLDVGETQIPSNINLGAEGIQFCEASLARRDLLLNNNWTFNDDGIGCPEEDKLIMVWKTTSNNENVKFQFTGGNNFYTVDWGDGTVENDLASNQEHTYAQAGTYEVKLTGNFRLRYNNLPASSSTRLKLYEIKQWGANPWTSTADAFYGCENLKITATDVPDLSLVTDMSDMFRNCYNLEDLGGQMGTWDVSTVENFNTMFQNTTSFSRSIGDWDLASATNMSNMLNNSGLTSNSYDLTLVGWRNNPNTPSNINLGASGLTYCNAVSEHDYLDNDLSWNFNDAGINCPANEPFITRWETTTDNETITIPTNGAGYNYYVDWGDGTAITFETGNATHEYSIQGMYDVKITGAFPSIFFQNAISKNKILSVEQWGGVEWSSMIRAFRGCSNLVINATDVPDLSKVTNMIFMFDGTTSLVDYGGRMGDWNVSNVTSMGYLFDGSSFNENINSWDVSKVTFMGFIFRDTPNFNQPLNNWQLSNEVSLFQAFKNAIAFNQDLGSWDISGVTSMGDMFNNCGMSTENYDSTLIGWATLDADETRIPTDLNLGADGLNYCLSETERNTLTGLLYNWIITDAGLSCNVQLASNVYIQGAALNPIVGEEMLMRDDLRVAGLLPTTSPYADGISCDISVFNTIGNDAIVDWVWVELRDENDDRSVLHSTSALLQRDGSIVDVDGTSALSFETGTDDFYVAVKHRNHLGIMTVDVVTLSNTITTVDFTDANNQITFGTDAQTTFGTPSGVVAMWAGDTNGDGRLNYSGTFSDIPSIRSQVFNDPNNSVFGGPPVASYPSQGHNETDVNMDGVTVYSGSASDVLQIRNNIFNNPSNSVFGGPPTSTYVFVQQLPEGANN